MDNSRRFRGIFGIAATWGIALSTLATGSLALGLATGLVPSSVFGAGELVAVALRGLLGGSVAGGLFAWMLVFGEKDRTLATLSMRQFALWGFLAAGSVPLILALAAAGPVLPFGVMIAGAAGFGALGSVLSTATLRIARRAVRLEGPDDQPLQLR